MTYAELVALIVTTGHRVALPGEQNVSLPCYALNPRGITLQDGFPVAYELVEISSVVPLSQNNVAQWELARTMMYDLMAVFMSSPVMFDAEIEVVTNTDAEPASISYVMLAQFTGQPICQNAELLITGADPELIEYLIRSGLVDPELITYLRT